MASFTGTPPIAKQLLISGMPYAFKLLQNWWIISNVCFASSLDGHIINPYGPSFFMNGNFTSCSKQNITKGKTKTIVLPEPVNAMPIISLPESLKTKTCLQKNENRMLRWNESNMPPKIYSGRKCIVTCQNFKNNIKILPN